MCVDLAPAGVQVVAIGGEEQMGEASVVAGGQQGQQGAVLTGVEAGAAGVRAAGVNSLTRAEAEAGDDADLALFLHCSGDRRAAFSTTFDFRHFTKPSLFRRAETSSYISSLQDFFLFFFILENTKRQLTSGSPDDL